MRLAKAENCNHGALTRGMVAYALASAAIVSLLFPQLALAYVDPSVVTYAVQAIAGVAVAISAVIGVAFRKVRRKIFDLFNIDENARKEVDPEFFIVDSQEDNLTLDVKAIAKRVRGRHAKQAIEEAEALTNAPVGVKMHWPRRFICAVLVSAFAVLTIAVLPPAEILAGAGTDLLFGIREVLPVMVQFAAVVGLIVAVVLSLFNGRVYAGLLALVFALGVCCYVQAMFLNTGIPAANGQPIDWWGDYSNEIIISGIVWVAIIVLCVGLSLWKVRLSRALMSMAAIALFIVQFVGVASLFSNATEVAVTYEGDMTVTDDGLFNVSDQNNIIVFILDMYDTRDLDSALKKDPHILDEMEGFTWYREATETILPTKYALPYLLTHEMIQEDEHVSTYLWRRYEDSTFIRDVYNCDYSVGVYSTNLHLGSLKPKEQERVFLKYCMNAHGLGQAAMDTEGTIQMMMQCALYRDMPWAFKSYFRFYTDDLNTRCKAKRSAEGGVAEYTTDDAEYYQRLLNEGLQINNEESKGVFRFVHLLGAHYPYTIDENGLLDPSGETSRSQQARGSMHMMSEYLHQLKELGVYDNSTIVITADHGRWSASKTLPKEVVLPILLVKERNASHKPFEISGALVSHEDFAASVLKWAGASESKVESYGTPFSEVDDPERVRDSYQITNANGHVLEILKYKIGPKAFDIDDWHYTGTYWSAMETPASTREAPPEIAYGGDGYYDTYDDGYYYW